MPVQGSQGMDPQDLVKGKFMVKGKFTVKGASCPPSPCPTAHLKPGRPGSQSGGKMRLPGARSGAADV